MPGLIKEDIDRWYDVGIYPRTRTIYLGGLNANDYGADETFVENPGINWNTARRLIKGIHLFDSNAQNGEKPITIIMNSCGGDWSHGMAIFDAIRQAKNHITIINMSHARSMSSLIFQAADYRITAPSGFYMIHDGYLGSFDIPRSVISAIEYEKKIGLPMMYKIYLDRLKEKDEDGSFKVGIREAARILNEKLPEGAERIRVSRGVGGIRQPHIQQLCSRDTFFTPEEMIRLNFADRLLETNDLAGAYANPNMHGLPTGLESLEPIETEDQPA